MRPSQFVVVLQSLAWLCRPMRKWQSLLHMPQMKLEEGKIELFCGECASLQLSRYGLRKIANALDSKVSSPFAVFSQEAINEGGVKGVRKPPNRT